MTGKSTDLQIAARLTDVWDIIQFNFWTDHPSDTMVNNIVQVGILKGGDASLSR